MASQLVNDEHPLALELKNLRAAVVRFQEEAHASALKLQRHSLDVSKVQQRAIHLERENEVLKSELRVLRATPHPDAGSSSLVSTAHSTQIQELTLSLRRLSHKLTLTEETLLSKTTELVAAQADLAKSRTALEEAYALGARVRGREEAGLAREREVGWKLRRLEEEKRMTDGVLGEYARLVRGLEAKLSNGRISTALPVGSPTTPNTPENGHARTSSTSSQADPLSSRLLDATFTLKQLDLQYQAESEELHKEVQRLRTELEVANSKLDGENKGEKTVLAEVGRTRTELEKLRIEDGSAAKMVARYMQFSQSSTNTLLSSLSSLKIRHAATLSTLTAQNHNLTIQRTSIEAENAVLRDRLDEIGAELAKEVYGRRREVGLRIKMGGREEGVREGLGRWVRRGEEAVKRLSVASDEEGGTEGSQEMEALLTLSQDARIVLASLDEGLFDAETALTLSGAKARGILLQAGLDGLLDELKAESERKAKAERNLVEMKAVVSKVSVVMDEAAVEAMDDEDYVAHRQLEGSRYSPPAYEDRPPQPPPKALDELVDTKAEESVDKLPNPSLSLDSVDTAPAPSNATNDVFSSSKPTVDMSSSSTTPPNASPDPESTLDVPPASDTTQIPISEMLLETSKPDAPTPSEGALVVSEPSTPNPLSAVAASSDAVKPDAEPTMGHTSQSVCEVLVQDAAVVVPTISVSSEVLEDPPQPTADVHTGVDAVHTGEVEEQEETMPATTTDVSDKTDEDGVPAPSSVAFPSRRPGGSIAAMAAQRSGLDAMPQAQTNANTTSGANIVAFPTEPSNASSSPLPTEPAPDVEEGAASTAVVDATLPDTAVPLTMQRPELTPTLEPVTLPPTGVAIAAPSAPAPPQQQFGDPSLERQPVSEPIIEAAPGPESEPMAPPALHPLLAELSQVSKRYDHLQRAFRDCHLALEGLKASLASTPSSRTLSPSLSLPKEILGAAVDRLDDYTEDVRVELEIKVGDEELLAKGYEALLCVPGALASSAPSSSSKKANGGALNHGHEDDDPPTQSEVETQIQAFVNGSDPAVRKARETFERKLEDVQHDIARLKLAVHDPESLISLSAPPLSAAPESNVFASPSPVRTDDRGNGGGWTSWIRGSPSTSHPPSPVPPTTFGNIMTNPRLRHSPSLGAGQLQGQSNGHGFVNGQQQQQQQQETRARRGSFFGLNLGGGEKEKERDPLASLALRVPMPSFTSFTSSSFSPNKNPISPAPSSSSSPFGFGAFNPALSPTFNYGGLGAGTPTPTRTRTVSTMYMLGLSSPGSATGRGRMSGTVSGSGLGSPLGMSKQASLSSQSGQSSSGGRREENGVKRVGEETEDETDEESEDDMDVE